MLNKALIKFGLMLNSIELIYDLLEDNKINSFFKFKKKKVCSICNHQTKISFIKNNKFTSFNQKGFILNFNEKNNGYVLCFDCFIIFLKAIIFIETYSLSKNIKFNEKYYKILLLPFSELSDYFSLINNVDFNYDSILNNYNHSLYLIIYEQVNRGNYSISFQKHLFPHELKHVTEILDLRFIISFKSISYLINNNFNYNEILKEANKNLIEDFQNKLNKESNFFDINMIRLRKLLTIIS